MKVLESLLNIQKELKAPKNQFNSFGKYKYRSVEDIMEAVKPLCHKNKVVLTLSDDIIQVGDRYYVQATATLKSIEDDSQEYCTASARESENKKGMDSAQVTGSTSSYARKYALNGLFNIDDTKDHDYNNTSKEYTQPIEDNLNAIDQQAIAIKKALPQKLKLECPDEDKLRQATNLTLGHFKIRNWKSLDFTQIKEQDFLNVFVEKVATL